jgi:MFS family permease
VTAQDAAAGSPGHEAGVTTGPAGRETATPTNWLPITVLALAQFVMVLDSTVMNVSLSTIQADLNTTNAMLQLAITLFTLTTAALMLVGGKLGDLMGRKRVFMIGLVVYSIGSLTTALSPNVYVLILGWSIIEALGAVMVIPAIAALTAGNYTGRQRASAFAIIGGAAGAAVAAGPLIGGLATTYLSWRIVFVGEVLALLVVMAFARKIKAGPKPEKGRLDVVGAILSASGLVLVILGVLKSSEWGLVAPKGH